jgi:hypothetical protein
MHIHPKPGAKPPAKLWFLLTSLWNEKQRFLLGLPSLVDEFEHTIQDPKEKAYLSAYIQNQFSDLGVLARSLHELDIYQPWAEGFDNDFEVSSFSSLRILTRIIWYLALNLWDVIHKRSPKILKCLPDFFQRHASP